MSTLDARVCQILAARLKAAGHPEEAAKWETRVGDHDPHSLGLFAVVLSDLEAAGVPAGVVEAEERPRPVSTEALFLPLLRACELCGADGAVLGSIVLAPHPLPPDDSEMGYMAIWMEGGLSSSNGESGIGAIVAEGPAHFGKTRSLALCAAIEAAP